MYKGSLSTEQSDCQTEQSVPDYAMLDTNHFFFWVIGMFVFSMQCSTQIIPFFWVMGMFVFSLQYTSIEEQ